MQPNNGSLLFILEKRESCCEVTLTQFTRRLGVWFYTALQTTVLLANGNNLTMKPKTKRRAVEQDDSGSESMFYLFVCVCDYYTCSKS